MKCLKHLGAKGPFCGSASEEAAMQMNLEEVPKPFGLARGTGHQCRRVGWGRGLRPWDHPFPMGRWPTDRCPVPMPPLEG